MLSINKIGLIAVMVLLLAGCAGRDFVRPSSDTFKLGQTTYSQVVQQMGEPRRTGEALVNEKNVKTATYVYASAGGSPSEDGVTPARGLMYYFHNDILVGQEFVSSFKSDSSNFDESKISDISKGKTTREEVIQLLGRPTANYISPIIKQTSGEALGYAYTTTRKGFFGSLKFFRKILRITFDDHGVVSDVEYSASENK